MCLTEDVLQQVGIRFWLFSTAVSSHFKWPHYPIILPLVAELVLNCSFVVHRLRLGMKHPVNNISESCLVFCPDDELPDTLVIWKLHVITVMLKKHDRKGNKKKEEKKVNWWDRSWEEGPMWMRGCQTERTSFLLLVWNMHLIPVPVICVKHVKRKKEHSRETNKLSLMVMQKKDSGVR